MQRVSKRIVAIGLPLALTAASGAAFAYWTAGGSGSGSAATATSAAALAVAQTGSTTGLAPGAPAAPISVSVSNNGTSSAYATRVTVSIASVTKATGAPAGTCAAADYTLAGEVMTNGAADLDPGEATPFTGASIVFNNTTANQDACKGATVNLSFVVS